MTRDRFAGGHTAAVTLFAIALVVRLVFSMTVGADVWRTSDDGNAYQDLAANLVTRHQFVTVFDPPHRLDVAYVLRPPLTPLMLASAYALFGSDVFVGRMVFAVLGGLTSVGVFLLGRRFFPVPVALLAAALTAVHPFFVFTAAMPLTENLALCLYTFLALSLVSVGSTVTARGIVATGALLGLSALNRPQALGLMFLLPLWAWCAFPRHGTKRTAVLAGVVTTAAVIMSPWIIRNYALTGHWVPISAQAGVVLRQANNPYAGTALTRLEQGSSGWYNDVRWQQELGQGPGADLDRRAFGLAVAFIRDQPSAFLQYALRRIRIFWSAYDHPIHRATWYPVLLLSAVGMLGNARRWREMLPIHLLVAQTMATAAIFTSLPRFRTPIEPFLLLFAAAAVFSVRERVGIRRSRDIGGVTRVAIVSHTYVVSANRGKLDALAALPGTRLLVIVPRRWVNRDIWQTLTAEPGEGAYELEAVAAAAAGHGSLLLYSPWQTARLLIRFGPHLVHVEQEPWTLAALELGLITRIVGGRFAFFTWQNIDRPLSLPFRLVRRLVFRLADSAVAGNAEAAAVLRRHGFRRQVAVIPQLGIHIDRFHPSHERGADGSFVIGFLGRLVPQKGVGILLQAVARLGPDVRLLCVGSGPYGGQLQRDADAVGVTQRLEMVAQVPHANVSRYLGRMDVLVLPSVTTPTWKEQFGHVLIEAMACGVPVVGSDSGAIPEVVADAGLIIKEGDADALAEALRQLQRNGDLRRELALRGRARAVSNFSNSVVARRLATHWAAMTEVPTGAEFAGATTVDPNAAEKDAGVNTRSMTS